MYASLGCIDISGRLETTGQKVCVQTDHREAWECDETREISTLFALTRVLIAGRSVADGELAPLVRYLAEHEPPAFLQAAIAAGGGRLEVDSPPMLLDGVPSSATGSQARGNYRPVPFEGTLPSAADLADGAFRDLAGRLLARRGDELRDEALVLLEQETLAMRPSEDEDEIAYWTCVLELAAVCGELLRRDTGGRWADDPHRLSAIPFAFELPEGGLVNVAGKAQRFLANGVCDSPHHLLRMAEGGLRGGEQPGPLMLTFKPADWSACDKTVGRPLFDSDDAAYADLPWIVYGRDTPHSISMFTKDGTREHEIAELHRQALENLRDVRVELHEIECEGLEILMASGSYYASEKILDVAFMRQMHERLGTPLIAAGVPRKGLLVMTSALLPAERMGLFLGLLEFQLAEEGEGQPLSACPMIVHEGEVQGVIRKNSDPASQASCAVAGNGRSPMPGLEDVSLTVTPRQQAASGASGAGLQGGPGAGEVGTQPPSGALATPPAPCFQGVPGASVTPGPLPPILVDFSLPPMLWISRAAAVLAEAGLVQELAIDVRTGRGAILIPALCNVGGERWAPYFEVGPWHSQAVGRLMHTLSVLRESQYRDLRLQVYSPFAPPAFVLDCLRGGPLPPSFQRGGTKSNSVLVAAGIALAVILVGGFLAMRPPETSPPPVARPARVGRPTVEPPPASPAGQKAGQAAASQPSAPAGAPVVDDPNRFTPAEQAQVASFLQGKRIPPECLPREVAAPGIENAWTVSGYDDSIPRGLKSTFTTREIVSVSVLERRVRRGQQLRLMIRRQGAVRPLLDQVQTIDQDYAIEYLGAQVPPALTQAPGAYSFDIDLDGMRVKSVPFTVVP